MRAHRTGSILLLLWLAGCSPEPDFDERYAEQREQLESEARAMEAELERQMAVKPGADATEPGREAPAPE